MLKNDEEPARHEGGEAKPSKEMLPDKSVGDTLENTFIFLLLEKKNAPFVSLPCSFFPNSLEVFLQVVPCDSKADNSCKQSNKKGD